MTARENQAPIAEGPVGRYSSPRLILALVVVCAFAPYGALSAGGGTLRLDHIMVPVVFVYCLLRQRLHLSSPLLKSLALFVLLSVLATALSLDLFFASPFAAIKNLDGVVRGVLVLAVASTMLPSERGAALLLRGFTVIAIVLAVMAAADRVVPADTFLMQRLIEWYGGPVPTEGVYALLGVNHKAMMLQLNRASAVFVTAPSLGMVSLFFIAVGMARGAPLGRLQRTLLIGSGLAAGIASNSKSFIFGVVVLGGLAAGQRQSFVRRLIQMALLITAMAVLIIISGQLGDPELASNPLTKVTEADNMTYGLSGGRFGNDEWDAWAVVDQVLDESPLLGFGLGQRHDVIYSDSALNRFMLHAGLLGALVAFLGIGAQLFWFARHSSSLWSSLGFQVMAVAAALFVAGPIFMMPRVNDILFTILGVSIAFCNAQRAPMPEHRGVVAPLRAPSRI